MRVLLEHREIFRLMPERPTHSDSALVPATQADLVYDGAIGSDDGIGGDAIGGGVAEDQLGMGRAENELIRPQTNMAARL